MVRDLFYTGVIGDGFGEVEYGIFAALATASPGWRQRPDMS